MRKFLWVLFALALLPAFASAQDRANDQYIQGYGFVAPGVAFGGGESTGFLHFGGGGEANLYKGIGFGGELGYLAPFHYMDQGVGLLSVNGIYRFRLQGNSKLEPFASGGYSLIFRSGSINAMNIGGGVHYWFKKKVGLRLEIRDHFSPKYFGDHLVQGRIGFAFR